VRRKAGGLAPGAICGLLVVVVVMTCKWCVDEDYTTREVEMRWAWRGRERGARTLGGGDGEEGGTAPAVERRRGEGEREGPGGGGDRGGRDGLHGRREGERSEVGCSRREIFFVLRLENFISFLKERVRISGGWTPLAHLVGFRIFPFVEI